MADPSLTLSHIHSLTTACRNITATKPTILQDELKNVRKILLYAPGTPEGRGIMESILGDLGLRTKHGDRDDGSSPPREDSVDTWHLLPMLAAPDPSNPKDDLRSHDLGSKLEDALVRVRRLLGDDDDDDDSAAIVAGGGGGGNDDGRGRRRGIVFLGMDAPVLPLDDIVGGLLHAACGDGASPSLSAAAAAAATLCPARDGGYAMLCVPPTADPARTFRNLYWSHHWTGMSQTKALTDQGIRVRIGAVVTDIDEAGDVRDLCRHLGIDLPSSSSGGGSSSGSDAGTTAAAKTSAEPKNLEFPCGWSPPVSAEHGDEHRAVTKQQSVASSHPTCHFTRMVLEEVMAGRR